MYARDPLQLPQYSEQIAGARITPWAQHAHEALGRRSRGFGERFEPNGGVDVIAQDRLTGLEVPGQELFGRFGEQRLTEGRITVCPRLHGLFEFLRQRHLTFPSFVAFCSPPTAPAPLQCRAVVVAWCRPRAISPDRRRPVRNRPGNPGPKSMRYSKTPAPTPFTLERLPCPIRA